MGRMHPSSLSQATRNANTEVALRRNQLMPRRFYATDILFALPFHHHLISFPFIYSAF